MRVKSILIYAGYVACLVLCGITALWLVGQYALMLWRARWIFGAIVLFGVATTLVDWIKTKRRPPP